MLVFISTFVSPHTLPLGIALSRYYDRVVFVNTMALTQERKQMGYEVADPRIQIKNYYEDPESSQKLIDEANVVILAGTSFDLVAKRIAMDKPVFLAHERIFKKGAIKLLDPRTWRISNFCRRVKDKRVYLLAIGDNAAKDFRLLGFNSRKIYRFGYFPQVKTYSSEQLQKEGAPYQVLWVGRFVDFKRPLMAVKAFRKMGHDFKLVMAGNGALRTKTQVYAQRNSVDVEFLGNIPAAEVEQHMLQSHILLSTSHKGEGWGAVINEGMNRGCAVVCAKQIGCAGTLANKDNAVLFDTHSVKSLRSALKEAALRQQELGQSGYCTVTQWFNADVAAERFSALAAADGVSPWESGLCSKVF